MLDGRLGPFVSFDTKGRQSQMLRHAHIYIKGGLPTFAALCIEVRFVGHTALRQSSLELIFK